MKVSFTTIMPDGFRDRLDSTVVTCHFIPIEFEIELLNFITETFQKPISLFINLSLHKVLLIHQLHIQVP
jgi:hypothetical protein